MPSIFRQIIRFLILALGAVLISSAQGEEKDNEARSAEVAVEQRLLDSVKFLASDELEGRGIGSKGLNLAAEYIAKEFARLGLQTSLYEGHPYQKFSMVHNVELGPQDRNTLVFRNSANGGTANTVEFKFGADFNTLSLGGSSKVSAEVVFVGYGITAKEHDYDDYAGLDVTGKVVVLIRKEPQQDDPHSRFDGTRASRYATFQAKVSNAYEHGAAAVILINDQHGIDEQRASTLKRFDDLASKLVEKQMAWAKQAAAAEPADEAERASAREAREKERSEYEKQVTNFAEQIAAAGKKLKENAFDRVLEFREAGDSSSSRSMPVFFVSRAKIDPILKTTLGTDLLSLEKEIDQGPTPKSRKLDGWRVDCEANLRLEEAEVKNVVAVLPGEGPRADQTIVVGAHYDHLGLGGNRNSLAPGTIAVHNGADDNASGTAALIEIARQLSARSDKPKRRIVFIAFTGEESGLEGSALYIKKPLFPLENTIAMVNLDMVGRMKENKLIVHGTGTAKEFDGLVDELNKRYTFELTKDPSGFGPSDHESFYVKSIPVFHLFTGTHNDYHRPSDDVEHINIEGMRRVASFAADIVTEIDTKDERPTYQETKRPMRDRGGSRPYLGSIPDFARKVEGYALMGVVPDSPADKAGILAGDVIVKLGDSKIGGLEDIDSALRKFKAGETVKVVVLRGTEMKTLEVTLGAPR